MNYHESIEYIHSLSRFGSKPGLQRVKTMLTRLENPHRRLKFIHIAGTNGKGSTAAFLSSILTCAGYVTGLYTSPYVVRFNERIRLNGEEITNDDLKGYVSRIKSLIDSMVQEGFEHPTEFEVITALAFLYFAEKGCDVVVLEVGMGGRFDATNIIENSVVSVITKIARDHMAYLGKELSEIAYEKAGIIKPGGKVVVYPQEPSAQQTIERIGYEKNAKIFPAQASKITDIEMKKGRLVFHHPRYGRIHTSIVGIHQVNNAAVALETIEVLNQSGFSMGKEAVINGFMKAKWIGRFELLHENPDFYIDAAHNPDGVLAFVDTFRRLYPGKQATVIFGVMKDKEYERMIKELSVITERFIAITPDFPRALPAESLYEVMRKYCKNVEFSGTIKEAVEKSIKQTEKNSVIAALGSLYYIGQVRLMFEK